MSCAGIVVAKEVEKEAILNIMENVEEIQISNLRFLKGNIKNSKCILVKSGIGKVNAARTTQVMIDNFDIKFIINLGAGASINPMLHIGDVLIGKYALQHDFDITAFGHSKGYITGIGNNVECDKELVLKFQKIIKHITELTYEIKFGVIATGDIFCTDIVMKDKIQANFDADVIDMECAAVGQVAYLNDIPFAALRSISDTPNGKNTRTFEENFKLASRRCANILEEFLK